MEENKMLMLEYLDKKNDWVTSKELSTLLSVSTRTIRNYVNQLNTLNKEYEPILSSTKGYKINQENYNLIKYRKNNFAKVNTPKYRRDYIRNKLIIYPKGYNLYNFAAELYISEETILNDIKNLQEFFKKFNLEVKRQNSEIFFLHGLERDKRKMIRHIINSESTENFIPTEALGMFSMNLNDNEYNHFRNSILNIFNKNNLFINDYALNNITLHLIVMTQRINKGFKISEDVPIEKIKNTKEAKVALEINKHLNKDYGITMNKSEFYYLTLAISSNTSEIDYSLINMNNINDFIEEKYIDMTKHAVQKAEKIFLIDIFNDDFLTKFILHVRNLMIRIDNNFYAKNPLTIKVKETYPLIYDIAVFIAMELQKYSNVYIREDEIAYLAIHIGAEIEKKNTLKNKITAVFVYADYYNIHTYAYEKIKRTFNNDLEIINIISVNKFWHKKIKSDIIISCVPITSDEHITVTVNPFVNDEDIENIRSIINKIKKNEKQTSIDKHLKDFFNPRFFLKNFYLNNEFEMIEYLTNEVINLGYAKPSFYKEVIHREKMSSTAFGNLVAVPHSMKQNSNKSFISIVINEKPMKWGNHFVNIIVLIGISINDRPAFREVFDILIEILSEPHNVQKLIRCKDFDGFLTTIANIISLE